MFTSYTAGSPRHSSLASRSNQNSLEPLLLLPAGSSKQIEGEVPARQGRLSFPLRSARPSSSSSSSSSIPRDRGGGGRVLADIRLLALGLGHEVVLLGQLDADGILLVPYTLLGQGLRN